MSAWSKFLLLLVISSCSGSSHAELIGIGFLLEGFLLCVGCSALGRNMADNATRETRWLFVGSLLGLLKW